MENHGLFEGKLAESCDHEDDSWTALGAGLWECNACTGWLVHVHQCVCGWTS